MKIRQRKPQQKRRLRTQWKKNLLVPLLTAACAFTPAQSAEHKEKEYKLEQTREGVERFRKKWAPEEKSTRATTSADGERGSSITAEVLYERPAGTGDVTIGSTIGIELTPTIQFDVYRFKDGGSGFSYKKPKLQTHDVNIPREPTQELLSFLTTGLDTLIEQAEDDTEELLLSARSYLTAAQGVHPPSKFRVVAPQGLAEVLRNIRGFAARSEDGTYKLTLPFTGFARGKITEKFRADSVAATYKLSANLHVKAAADFALKQARSPTKSAGSTSSMVSLRGSTLQESSLFSSESMGVVIGTMGVRISERELDERRTSSAAMLGFDESSGGFEYATNAYRRELSLSELELTRIFDVGVPLKLGALVTISHERRTQARRLATTSWDDSAERLLAERVPELTSTLPSVTAASAVTAASNITGVNHITGAMRSLLTNEEVLNNTTTQRRTRPGILIGLPRISYKGIAFAGEFTWRSSHYYEGTVSAEFKTPIIDFRGGLAIETLPRRIGPPRTGTRNLLLSRALVENKDHIVSLGYEFVRASGSDLQRDGIPDRVLVTYEGPGLWAQLGGHYHHGAFTGATLMAIHRYLSLRVGYDTAQYGEMQLERLTYDSMTEKQLFAHQSNSFLSLSFQRYHIGNGLLNHEARLQWHRLW